MKTKKVAGFPATFLVHVFLFVRFPDVILPCFIFIHHFLGGIDHEELDENDRDAHDARNDFEWCKTANLHEDQGKCRYVESHKDYEKLCLYHHAIVISARESS